MTSYKVRDLLEFLSVMTGGRTVMDTNPANWENNPFVMIKSSEIPGKEILEIPGLVYGDPEAPIRRIALTITLTENRLELAGAIGVNVILVHHPVADAASSGGVPLRVYASLYDLNIIELHEAFHGLHPGIRFLHGFSPEWVELNYGGILGNVVSVGTPLPGVHTLGDILKRLDEYMGLGTEQAVLAAETKIRGIPSMEETAVAARPYILLGRPESPVRKILHFAPHGGFEAAHLDQCLADNPEIDTVVSSFSRPSPDGPLVRRAKEHGLNLLVGNCHVSEVYENWLPMAKALEMALPGVDLVVFHERVTATPAAEFGNEKIRAYAREMAEKHLVKVGVPSGGRG
ncbi:MAG: Nif3-like dinuclear metal center hexameric protein [Firmicutes bacterium]|nr:Nif3-like dinuclear metal center hexameric protein [Bacillota bacterium]